MSTPSDSPSPETPPPAAPAAPKPAAPKPAFKVTRSPFAPKLGGPGGPAPISIGSSAALSNVEVTSPGPTAARAPRAAAASRPVAVDSGKPALVGFVVDVIAAAVAVSFAILFALNYFSS